MNINCTHIFVFPEDKQENYNPDGKTLTGKCQCGVTQKAYGLNKYDFDEYDFETELDKYSVVW